MLLHATYILLVRPTVTPEDILSPNEAVLCCLEHSITASRVALNYNMTFDERLGYGQRYAWFVAA